MIPRPTTRLLALLELLQARDGLNGTDLARYLEVNPRSVRRYVAMLQDIGIPVEATRGPYGGYRLRPGYKLPPLMLTDEEALAVTLALLGAPRLGLALAPSAVAGAQAKLERVLPTPLRSQVQAVAASIAFDAPPDAGAARTAQLALLAEAAHDGRRVRLRYRSGAGAETVRTVDPYGVVRWSRAWYLAGYCHLRVGLRVFRLDRVLGAERLPETFAPPAAFDSHGYVAQTIAAFPGRWPVDLLLGLPLEEARRTTVAAYGTLAASPKGTVFQGRFDDLDGAARWLVTLGCPVTVREPPELRAALRRLAAAVAAMADGTADASDL